MEPEPPSLTPDSCGAGLGWQSARREDPAVERPNPARADDTSDAPAVANTDG